VLVDANWSNPQLAPSLGLLPQIGWEETLCGGLPLEEVVIESLADGLAVLPVREPSASAITQGQIAASFDILAREFDVVLVDLGPLAQLADESNPARGVAARMDAVIVVQNVRVTTPNRLAEVRQCLAASNLRYAGTIQNFVAG
jgi:Mrp family chromosome partitioning ATPase